MDATRDDLPPPVTLAEIVAAISLAADLGLGQPMEHVLRSCAMATAFAEHLDLSPADRAATYWTTLFVSAGCTGQSWELSRIFGDDLEWRAAGYRAGTSDLAQLRFLLSAAGAHRALLQRTMLRADLL